MTNRIDSTVAALSWGDGAMNLHVQRNWTMKQITSHVDAEWLAAWNRKPVTIELHEFGKIGSPLRKFLRNGEEGRWTEVKARPWPKDAVQGYHSFIRRQVQAVGK